MLSPGALERAQTVGASADTPMITVLLRLGLVDEDRLVTCLAEAAGVDLCPTAALPDEPAGFDLLPPRFLHAVQALPLSITPESAALALVDPTDTEAVTALHYRLQRPLTLYGLRASDFEKAFERLYG